MGGELVDKKELQQEQGHFDDTIQKITDKEYFIRELLEYKQQKLQGQSSDPGDLYTYRAGKQEEIILDHAREKPYFGRIDLKSDDGSETYYIGKQGVFDQDEDIIVVDWRMPLATVYYNFAPGLSNQSYSVKDNNGRIIQTNDVDVLQKREYTIKDRKLLKFSQQVGDVTSDDNLVFSEKGDETAVQDQFLKEILSEGGTTGYLKEIVATIQQEQNQAIREPINHNVIIQGVAGSGKSSIALHRLSYLLYNNNHVNPSDVLILGPSKLFISSFKDLLPELNLEGIAQSTYYEMVLEDLKPFLKGKALRPLQTYFEEVLFADHNEMERKRIQFKGSSSLALVIDLFLEEFELNYETRMKPIRIGEEYLISDELLEIYNGYAYLSLTERVGKFIEHVENHFKKLLKDKIDKTIADRNSIRDTYLQDGGLTTREYDQVVKKVEQVAGYKINKLKEEHDDVITKWKQTMTLPDPVTLYKQILQEELLVNYQDEIGLDIPKVFKGNVIKQLTYFDLPPIHYIYMKLYELKRKYAHIVIDEGQDLSYMHYAGLVKMTKTMTILGDKDQSIYQDYGIEDWNQVINGFFPGAWDRLLHLDTSYRSTKEISFAANQVLMNQYKTNHQPITALNRSGPEIEYTAVKSGADLMKQIQQTIEQWKEKYKRIAIIHKDMEKATKLADYLKNEFVREVVYINPDEEVTSGEISVLTSYNSKGMEFDAVILVNVNKENFPQDDLHARLLYVMLTRAQQEAKVFFQDSPSTLLEGLIKAPVATSARYDDIL